MYKASVLVNEFISFHTFAQNSDMFAPFEVVRDCIKEVVVVCNISCQVLLVGRGAEVSMVPVTPPCYRPKN